MEEKWLENISKGRIDSLELSYWSMRAGWKKRSMNGKKSFLSFRIMVFIWKRNGRSGSCKGWKRKRWG